MRNRVFREPGGTPRDFTANPPPQCETACFGNPAEHRESCEPAATMRNRVFREPLLFLFLKEQIKDIDRANERHQSESQRFVF
jgi:hypothetical protein